jgi:hypothetical protein
VGRIASVCDLGAKQEVYMAQEPTQDPKAFAQIVKGSLLKAQEQTAGLRKTSGWLLIASIVGSAATTLVAGFTAAAGPVVAAGDAGWRIPCIIAAAFAFISTVSTAVNQQLKIGDRLSQGNQCVGRLRALDIAIATGNQTWEEITKEYGEIARTYPELVG